MSETTERDTVTFRCEQCGREGGRAIFTCPERPSGRCPYVEQWRKKKLEKPLPIDPELSQPLAYPPSITALPTEQLYRSAVAILRTTLIGLLAKGHIQVHHSQIYEFKRWNRRQSVQDVYSIVPTEECDQVRFEGADWREESGGL